MRAMDREDLIQDPRFATIVDRIRNAEAGVEVIKSWMAESSIEEITEKLRVHGVPCGRVQDAEMLARDPQLQAGGAREHIFPSPRRSGCPWSTGETRRSPGEVKTPFPDLGEHTEEILKEVLGMGDEEIGELKREGII